MHHRHFALLLGTELMKLSEQIRCNLGFGLDFDFKRLDPGG
ncbi:hypothetical protein Hanom_Chr08g00707391 [Helianthus anomalus]